MMQLTKPRAATEVEEFLAAFPDRKSRSYRMISSVNGNIKRVETDDVDIRNYLKSKGFAEKQI